MTGGVLATRDRVVVLLTDYGAGFHAGVLHGVLATLAPAARVIDLTHGVRPGGVAEAAFLLATALPHFPAGSIFVGIVDPAVGTARRRLVVRLDTGTLLLGPDNGVLAGIVAASPGAAVREMTNSAWFSGEPSPTFEGRSHFAPAAAALWNGARFEDAGPVVSDATPPADAGPVDDGLMLTGRVVWVDGFGNLVTSFSAAAVATYLGTAEPLIELGGGLVRGIARTFADVLPLALVAYIGSSGFLEVAVRDGSAAQRLRADISSPVVLRRRVASKTLP